MKKIDICNAASIKPSTAYKEAFPVTGLG